MSHRSRKHKKRFSCNHRGFGKYCHRCAEQAKLIQALQVDRSAQPTNRTTAKTAARMAARIAWQESFTQDEIDLRDLPKPVVIKSRRVLQQLQQGVGYWQLGGKRLKPVREIISIPIGYRYRLLCREEGTKIVPLEVVSHEDYNPLIRQVKRLVSKLFSWGSGKG